MPTVIIAVLNHSLAPKDMIISLTLGNTCVFVIIIIKFFIGGDIMCAKSMLIFVHRWTSNKFVFNK